MKIKLTCNSPLLIKHTEQIIELQSEVSVKDIEALFYTTYGVLYNKKYCTYEVLEGATIEEILAYTE
jgi:molybdenum cofactor biosynthesis enzyme MoaA